MCIACNLNLVHQMYEQVDLTGKNAHRKNFFKQAYYLNGIFFCFYNWFKIGFLIRDPPKSIVAKSTIKTISAV